jgi:hypothetical protein
MSADFNGTWVTTWRYPHWVLGIVVLAWGDIRRTID